MLSQKLSGFRALRISQLRIRDFITAKGSTGLRGGPNVQLPGTLRRRWNNLKYGASKLRCPHEKESLRTLSAVLVRALKIIRQPCPRPKKFKEYRFEGAPNY